MVDLPNREDIEAELARRLSRVLAAFRREIVDLLGDPPNTDNITREKWLELETALNGQLLPVLVNAFEESTQAQAAAIGYAIDLDVVNQRAQQWARGYTFELVRGINSTSQARLQTAVSNYFERGVTIGDLRAEISQIFSPVRADMIAQTEVTRAAVEGERTAARALEAQGVQMRAIHQTNIDDRVCPICGPRHGQVITDGRFPPLHVRCRCWVNYEVVNPTPDPSP